jgi:hypothetical protein
MLIRSELDKFSRSYTNIPLGEVEINCLQTSLQQPGIFSARFNSVKGQALDVLKV